MLAEFDLKRLGITIPSRESLLTKIKNINFLINRYVDFIVWIVRTSLVGFFCHLIFNLNAFVHKPGNSLYIRNKTANILNKQFPYVSIYCLQRKS